MLRYVTDPNHVDSYAAYVFMSIHMPAFCGGKALNENVKHFVFDLTCHVTCDSRVKFFKLYLKDLVQATLLPFEFFCHVHWFLI